MEEIDPRYTAAVSRESLNDLTYDDLFTQAGQSGNTEAVDNAILKKLQIQLKDGNFKKNFGNTFKKINTLFAGNNDNNQDVASTSIPSNQGSTVNQHKQMQQSQQQPAAEKTGGHGLYG